MLLIGVAGTELTAQERDWLQHDAVAGVVLFKRNFASRQQVTDLSAAIRAAAPRPQLICVDQEGGRVQRFREGYSDLPPLQDIGALYATDPQQALALAERHAWLMASEVRASGVDLSFAPVVDLGRGNRAIGNRAFSEDPQVVAAFTAAYVRGMHSVGMAATLKHFPGHGTVLEDTHVDTAIDPRALDALRAQDLVPFQAGIAAGADAVMMAHVIYPQIAPEPAGYSPRWIQDILRGELGFRGVVFSDDIGMAASHSAGVCPRACTRIWMPAATWCWSATRNWSMKPCTRCRDAPQHCCAAGPDRPWRAWLGWPAGRCPPWRHPIPSA